MRKQTKKQKVLKLLAEGMKPKDIAAKLKMNVQQVYVIKSDAKKKMQLPGQVVWVKDGVKFTHAPLNIHAVGHVKKSFFQKIKDFLGV